MTSLKDALKSDLTAAMKAGDNMLKSTLRMAIAAVMNAEVAGSEAVELSDDQVLKILQAETKKRLESAEIYQQAGRTDSAAQESAEAEILSRYLPAAMSDDELLAIVNEEVAAAVAAGNEGAKAMGLVVKAVRGRAGSSADGAKIAALVKSALSGSAQHNEGPKAQTYSEFDWKNVFLREPPKQVIDSFLTDLARNGILFNISTLGRDLQRIRTAEIMRQSVKMQAEKIYAQMDPEDAAKLRALGKSDSDLISDLVVTAIRKHLTGYFDFD